MKKINDTENWKFKQYCKCNTLAKQGSPAISDLRRMTRQSVHVLIMYQIHPWRISCFCLVHVYIKRMLCYSEIRLTIMNTLNLGHKPRLYTRELSGCLHNLIYYFQFHSHFHRMDLMHTAHTHMHILSLCPVCLNKHGLPLYYKDFLIFHFTYSSWLIKWDWCFHSCLHFNTNHFHCI